MNIRLQQLNAEWFAENGTTDPVGTQEAWTAWFDAKRTEASCYRKALELASGLTAGAVRHYLYGRCYKLSEPTLARLDAISQALDVIPPQRKERPAELIRSSLMKRRIALLTELEDVPSLSYHLAGIRSITRIAADHNFSLALHDVSQINLAEDIQRIARNYRPSAIVMLRLTPNAQTIQSLSRASIPTVLVHADRLEYPGPPVLANIIPAQEVIEERLREWAGQVLPKSEGQIIVIAMPDEQNGRDFPNIGKSGPGIREGRKSVILSALQAFCPVVEEVADYSFRHALPVVKKYPDACLYVCLSDEIAVAIKHLLIASGQPFRNRIIGFDDSLLAKVEQISSFGHQLSEIGERAVELIIAWSRRMTEDTMTWPTFHEAYLEVRMVPR